MAAQQCSRLASLPCNCAAKLCPSIRHVPTQSRARLTHCASSSSDVSANTPSSSLTPWSFVYDLRERETLWLDHSKARLVTIIARDQLKISQQELEDRMDILLTLVPTLQDRIASLTPSLLTSLLKQPVESLADIIITLKDLFPAADIGEMLGKAPALLLQPAAALKQAAGELREVLQTEHVDKLVAEQPLFLDVACVKDVVKELKLLMPGIDVLALLRADPEWLLRAQRGQKWLGQNPDS